MLFRPGLLPSSRCQRCRPSSALLPSPALLRPRRRSWERSNLPRGALFLRLRAVGHRSTSSHKRSPKPPGQGAKLNASWESPIRSWQFEVSSTTGRTHAEGRLIQPTAFALKSRGVRPSRRYVNYDHKSMLHADASHSDGVKPVQSKGESRGAAP
jgi:hypothetical protein